MNSATQLAPAGPPRLTLFRPPDESRNMTRWRINGYGATITVWTAEEWDRLVDRPPHAQYCAPGVWCALQIDD